MTTASSFRSILAGFPAACALVICVLLIVTSVISSIYLRHELAQTLSEDSVECRERVDDIGKRLQWRAQLDRQHQLADYLASTRSDQGRTDQHSARSVAYQLERASMKVVYPASRGLGGISAGHDDVDAFGTRCRLR